MIKKRIAVFASGRGSNFQVIIDKTKNGFIPATIDLCITNNPNAGAIKIAERYNIPHRIFIPKEFPDGKSFNDTILDELKKTKINFIVLAGYLKLIGEQIVKNFENKIINIHPALLPSFGGKGMYGHFVHEAVYKSGVKISGPTVHLVNNEYDAGPIVLQKAISISNVESPNEIASRVLKIEHKIFPEAIKLLVEQNIIIDNNRVRLVGENKIESD